MRQFFGVILPPLNTQLIRSRLWLCWMHCLLTSHNTPPPPLLTNYFSLLEKKMDFFNSIPTHMDFEGQQKAEKLSRIIITLFGAVGLVWGYIIQQFSQTVYIVGAGFVLAALVTVPPWPMYRKKPLQWQKPRSENEQGDSHQKSKKKK